MEYVSAGIAGDAISKIMVDPLIRQIHDVIHMSPNIDLLQVRLESLKSHLEVIYDVFQHQQRSLPESITVCLKRTHYLIEEARSLIYRSQPQIQCLNCLFCKPRNSTQIMEWIARFDQLLQELEIVFSISANVQQIVLSAAAQAEELPQPVPPYGFVGSGIESAEMQLRTWLIGAPHVRVIGVYGMPGAGKTALLKTVYNSYKVSKVFDVVIWVTVSPTYEFSNLQSQIAMAINLDLSTASDINTRKMILSASLINKKFLLIFDDIWSPLDVQELGVAIDSDLGSKVVFSSRNEALIEAQKSIRVELLSMNEGWQLFERVAFRQGNIPEELKECAREIADECEGLPLAIVLVAAAMSHKRSIDEWSSALSLMKNADPSFPETQSSVDQRLYGLLRWSYDDLVHLSETPNLQFCFLYCAMFPEDKKIEVDVLVRMWIAEGYIQSDEGTYSRDMAVGHRYVKFLIDRGLFQNVNFEKQSMYNVKIPVNVWKPRYITVHDVIRDLAIYIGEKEENYLCRAGQQLKDFPHSETQYYRRISLRCNQIEYLPNDFRWPRLATLILSENPLTKVPESFLINLTSLRVLDLSNTNLLSVPGSLSLLRLLEFLTLKNTPIRDLPENLCNLSALQCFDLSFCRNLESLPSTIGKLTQLQFLNLMGLPHLVIPLEISQLISLKRLELQTAYGENSQALKGLTNLMELSVTIISETGEHEIALSSGTWLEMRHLSLRYESTGANRDLPQEMQRMNKLQSFQLFYYKGVNTLKSNLPNWICDFQELERLELIGCDQLTELPPLERLPKLKFLKFIDCSKVKYLGIGCSSIPDAFPVLERLDLIEMLHLRGMMTSSSNVLIKGSLPSLRFLKIKMCPKLKKLPMRMESLPNLAALIGEDWWWNGMIWEDHYMKVYLHKLFRGI